jgi:hypothetical protein
MPFDRRGQAKERFFAAGRLVAMSAASVFSPHKEDSTISSLLTTKVHQEISVAARGERWYERHHLQPVDNNNVHRLH